MGADAGFDIFPCLTKESKDVEAWQAFMDEVQTTYAHDECMERKPGYIVFAKGEHPKLPFEGHKCLRFSAKVTGTVSGNIEDYISNITKIAKKYFGSRIHYWNELRNDWTHVYGWAEVLESERSYEQADTPTVTEAMDLSNLKLDDALEPNVIVEPKDTTESLPFFRVESIPDKGRGWVASRDIPKGTRIFHEKPLFCLPRLPSLGLDDKGGIVSKLKALSKEEQRQYLSLHNNFPQAKPFVGIYKTNALACGYNANEGAVYATISLINHSCRPNAHHAWNRDMKHETIHATRSIKEGEEITICYYNGPLRDARRLHLKRKFGFDCNCELCSASIDEIGASDQRRHEIQLIDEVVGMPRHNLNYPDNCIASCRFLQKLIKSEFGDSLLIALARLYCDTLQISIIHGDQARASVFAQKAYEQRVICEGEDSPDTCRVKDFIENPAAHPSFGISNRWKTTKSMIPTGLSPEDFENWLWARGQ